MDSIPLFFGHRKPTFDDLDEHGIVVSRDWFGQELVHKVSFLFWIDETHLHFLAGDEHGKGLCHPESKPGHYQAELWKYDVAEFFLMSADRSRYLEFNLGPNGAWWSCGFSAPSTPAAKEPTSIPEVTTDTRRIENSWQAMASIPRKWLNTRYGFGENTGLNASFILKSPDQIFLTAGDLGDGEPDFHRPEQFPTIEVISLA